MIEKIDSSHAKQVLTDALTKAQNESYTISKEIGTKIEQILHHTHLTYKYVLLNGLLAKATNPRVNPLALQAGAPIQGAYDARSLCHSVVVPFEQNVLERRLGGSNEPFLNKPARFTHLSLENAVRRGEDRKTLETLIELFTLINTSNNSFDVLVAVLNKILKLNSRILTFDGLHFKKFPSKYLIVEFINEILSESCEGESLVLITSFLFEIIYNDKNVTSHPVNQSGSSSKEISDIDVYDIDKLIICCEVKDKPFTKSDIDHAISKVILSQHNSMIFVYGRNSSSRENLENIQKEYESRGFDLTFLNIEHLTNSIIAITPNVTWDMVIKLINKHIKLIRAKESTINHCQNIIKKIDYNKLY